MATPTFSRTTCWAHTESVMMCCRRLLRVVRGMVYRAFLNWSEVTPARWMTRISATVWLNFVDKLYGNSYFICSRFMHVCVLCMFALYILYDLPRGRFVCSRFWKRDLWTSNRMSTPRYESRKLCEVIRDLGLLRWMPSRVWARFATKYDPALRRMFQTCYEACPQIHKAAYISNSIV